MDSYSSIDESVVNTSHSFSRHSQDLLISKILQLEAQLYQVSIDNQELRHKNLSLKQEYTQKRSKIITGQQSPKPQSLVRHRKQYSNTVFYPESSSPIHAYHQGIGVHSVPPGEMSPITGLQINFSVLKETQNQMSTSQSNVSQLSSPRATGIRKNIKSPRFSQEKTGFSFKSIDEIWNGKDATSTTQTFLKKKGSERSSYLTKKRAVM